MADEANAYFDQLKANAPLENQIVMDQIKAKYNATREKMKQNHNLIGLREKSVTLQVAQYDTHKPTVWDYG